MNMESGARWSMINAATRHAPSATILLPFDGAPASRSALPVARALAAVTGAPLHIVYAGRGPGSADKLGHWLGLGSDNLSGAVLNHIEAEAADGILEAARELHSLLIVMMMRRHAAAETESGLGPITQIVLRRAPCPVLLVPPMSLPEDWRLHHILLPQDGTPASAVALEPVARLAHHTHALLSIVHVCGADQVPPPEAGALSVPHYMDQPQHEWPAWAAEFVARVRGLSQLPTDMDLRLLLARGAAGPEIVRFAHSRHADLIAMPWHGRLEPEHAETLKTVLRGTPCPVLVAPCAIPPQRRRARWVPIPGPNPPL